MEGQVEDVSTSLCYRSALFLDRARVPLARSSAVGHALSKTTVPGVAHSFQASQLV